ncbi:hypothetical protein [Marinilactibacillus kalidii]|uniref:hypothetical protein n=1 Tax=Marinilactibacillus kalidii TaxID=2820274 RepID=UPI001ABE7780|nr:hypothetical protein [Marinilactibacillus kalidii]
MQNGPTNAPNSTFQNGIPNPHSLGADKNKTDNVEENDDYLDKDLSSFKDAKKEEKIAEEDVNFNLDKVDDLEKSKKSKDN